MPETARDVMTADPATIAPSTTVADAAARMRELDVARCRWPRTVAPPAC